MLQSSLPKHEAGRLYTLQTPNSLDKPRQERFDSITRAAQRLFDVSAAIITLVDGDREQLLSCQGLAITEPSRTCAFSAHAILGEDTLVVTDTLLDPRFAANPLVEGDTGIRFFAATALSASDGSKFGALFIMDQRPREM